MAEEDSPDRKTLILFGRDYAKIPCFRNSLLCGLMSGTGGGFAYFFYSSRPSKSFHVGMITFVLSTLGYWSYCRYDYAKTKLEMKLLGAGMKNKLMYEGTEEGKAIEEKLDLKSA